MTTFLSSVNPSRELSTESGSGTSSHWVYFYQSTYHNELTLPVSLCAVIPLRAITLYNSSAISSA